jgi:transcriptional regulator with XRE-family HTH domain
MRNKTTEKMTLESEFRAKLKALRAATGMNQGQFAQGIGVVQSLVSACELGKKTPSTDLLVRLGNAAAQYELYVDASWFWEQAGVNVEGTIKAAKYQMQQSEQRLKKLLQESPGVVRVPILRGPWHVAEPLLAPEAQIEEWLPLPSRMIPNPTATSGIRFRDHFSEAIFGESDLVLVDSSQADLKHLAAKRAAVYQSAEKRIENHMGATVTIASGVYVGWLYPFKWKGRLSAVLSSAQSTEQFLRMMETYVSVPTKGRQREINVFIPYIVVLEEGDRILGRVVGWIASDTSTKRKAGK